jgi:hypothetical protein
LRSKLLMGAVAASASLAFAGIAYGVTSPDGSVTFDATAKPADSGTKSKPKSVTLKFDEVVSKPNTTVEKIIVDLPKGLKFGGKGLKKCNAENLQLNGTSACPAGSKAGLKGTSTARIEPAGTALDFNVYPFVGGDTKILFYLVQTDASGNEMSSGIQSVLTGKITNKGRKLSIAIPQELRQPLGGLDATLTQIRATFKGKVAKHYVVSSTGCTGGKWSIKSTLAFAARSDGASVPVGQAHNHPVSSSK